MNHQPKRIEVEQGTPEWLALRDMHLCASDAPVIMGFSPWKTPYQLWEEKLGRRSSVIKETPAMRYGKEMEPIIRDQINEDLKLNFKPAVYSRMIESRVDGGNKSITVPCLASLDGIDGDRVLEIKCANSLDHQIAKNGKVPEKYYYQLVHQALVTGAQEIIYVSHFEGKNEIVQVPITRAGISLSELVEQLGVFWDLVQLKKAPKKTSDDILEVATNREIVLFSKLKEDLEILKEIESRIEETKSAIKSFYKDTIESTIKCGSLTYTKSERKGSLDYDKILKDTKADMDWIERTYRKPSTMVHTFKISKE